MTKVHNPLELIEAYYAVAQHLQAQGQSMLDLADTVGRAADQMSEQNMRQKQPADSAGGV